MSCLFDFATEFRLPGRLIISLILVEPYVDLPMLANCFSSQFYFVGDPGLFGEFVGLREFRSS